MPTWVEDLDVDRILALPDDGLRHELIDGVHHVTPAPAEAHQRAVAELLVRLWGAAPEGVTVRTAPYDWVVVDREGASHRVQPDLLVLTLEQARVPLLQGMVPLLVVEVLSPGAANRARDLQDKLGLYQRTGLPTYWVVDPGIPSIASWKRVGEPLVPAREARGDQWFIADCPFPVRLRPSDLADRAG